MDKRVVITGIGIVNPSGIGAQNFWNAVQDGKNSIKKIETLSNANMPTQVAGKLTNFEEQEYIPRRYLAKIDTFTKYAWAAAEMAIKDARLDFNSVRQDRTGVWLGNNAGGWDICERGLYEMYREGPSFVNVWQATAWFLSSPQGYLTIGNNLHGMSKSFACDRASAASAIYFAYRNIKSGINDVILTGGTEAPITPFAMNCYYDIGEMATTKDDTKSYKPFDKNATGLLIGEGAAIFILEELNHALNRGATIYAELISASSFTDADGKSSQYLQHSINQSLKKANLDPQQIDVIYGEGAGSLSLDLIEAEAINQCFSTSLDRIIASYPKSGFGHLYGASTATDFVCSLLAAKNNAILPTPNLEEKVEFAKFNIAQQLVSKEIDYSLILSRAREGANFTFITKKMNGEEI